MECQAISPGMGATQQAVHEMIQSVGGYWSPHAGVVRLLEEAGELCQELAESPSRNTPDLGAELADIWIISTCTANQFRVAVQEPRENLAGDERDSAGLLDALLTLMRWAGLVGRAINYYDGPKNPRTLDGWMPLRRSVPELHNAIHQLSVCLGTSLKAEIEAKLPKAADRDKGRFASTYDPTTAVSLEDFAKLRGGTPCPFAANSRLWGAPPWLLERSLEQNVAEIAASLTVFAKSAPHEHLDGYVVAVSQEVISRSGSHSEPMRELADWFRELLQALAAADSLPNDSFTRSVRRVGWQFSFHGLPMFVSVFSPMYDSNHPRHSDDHTFVMLQPEDSFTRHGIGREHKHSRQVKEGIRRQFAASDQPYSAELVERRIEADLYLPERFDGDSEVRWWKSSTTSP